MQTKASEADSGNTTKCELIGSACVAAMAEIESFMRDLVESIVHTINCSNYAISSLRSELHALHANTTFDQIQKMEKHNKSYWESRIKVTQFHSSKDTARLPEPSPHCAQPPLKGNTIQLADISEVANIFCFPNRPIQSLLTARQVTALIKLASHRNSFAHAVEPATNLFPNPNREIDVIMQYLSDVAHIIDVLASEWAATLNDRTFLVSTTASNATTRS